MVGAVVFAGADPGRPGRAGRGVRRESHAARLASRRTWPCPRGGRAPRQSWFLSEPPLLAKTKIRPSNSSGTSGDMRSVPDLAPMWCSSIRGLPENTPLALPPVARNSLITVLFIRLNSRLSMIVRIDGLFHALLPGFVPTLTAPVAACPRSCGSPYRRGPSPHRPSGTRPRSGPQASLRRSS